MPPPFSRLMAPPQARWDAMAPVVRGAALVSAGALTLVVMAIVTKLLGQRLSSFQILFFRSSIGLLFLLPLFARDPGEPFRTRRQGMHLVRGAVGSVGNICFFWTITHMLLADSMALQFSRPLFMIPLAVVFLGECAGLRRSLVALVGFGGILLYARPFTAGFDPNAIVGAVGALFAGLVVVCIKRLATSETTRVIMFYYAFWTSVFVAAPALVFWVTPTWDELMLLVLVGFLGISGQSMITHGLTMGDATALVPLDYSRVLYAAAFGYLIFGEVPAAWSLAGMALILGSSIVLVLGEKAQRRRDQISKQGQQ
jgi:drug/metabolite transporter (DMT)-like permease